MNVLIAADMEGVAGVVDWDHVSPKHTEYARFRALMTAEVNAAVRGACEAGTETVLVADGHAHGRNILIEDLDPRARLHSGSPSPLGMVSGVERGVDCALFVGYHARAGTERGILDHTWSGQLVMNLWLNGDLIGETGLNAALCGHFDVPVVMVSGDRAVCDEARALLGEIETAVVKDPTGRSAASCLPPEAAQERIYEAARQAVTRFKAGNAPGALRVTLPVTLTLELPDSRRADQAAFLPGAERDERRVSYTADNVVTAFKGLRSMLALAAG
jgi:D-amino peptidase